MRPRVSAGRLAGPPVTSEWARLVRWLGAAAPKAGQAVGVEFADRAQPAVILHATVDHRLCGSTFAPAPVGRYAGVTGARLARLVEIA